MDGGGFDNLPGTFDNQSYAFAVASGSPFREPISQEILRITNSDEWQRLKDVYLDH
ncbi:hypothetical protein [Pseudomonas sp. S9]|uniref:hypothetical protein n=1 Tax=Pseudomonas sp. S9 TaxID=686578 RepID=UPI00025566C6|nr:hypothetical protein [Pseudomonas sp. S9]